MGFGDNGFRSKMERHQDIRKSLSIKSFDVDLLDYRTIIQDNSGDYRTYHTPEGNEYISVTSWLGSLDKEDKEEGLKKWREMIGDEKADQISNTSRSRGTFLHKAVEEYIQNRPIPDHIINNPTVMNLFKPMKKWLDENVKTVLGSEIPLYSDHLQIAGSCDCFFLLNNGSYSVIDLKNSRKMKEEEWIKSYFHQCTLYSMMIEEMYGIHVDDFYVLISGDEGFQKFHKIPSEYVNEILELRLPEISL